MKAKISYIIVLFLIIGKMSFCIEDKHPSGIVDNVIVAIKAGNSKALAQYFNSTLEVSLPGKEGTFSKVQAEMIMKDFFSKNQPLSFAVDQKGNSAGGSQFIIGTYKSAGKAYKTYILLKPYEGQLLIQQIQFEAD